MHIVLHEPEIPGNTGNIGRSCAATNTSLHLIEPLGFDITEKELRRAGLDYWSQLDVHRYRDYEDFVLENFGGRAAALFPLKKLQMDSLKKTMKNPL